MVIERFFKKGFVFSLCFVILILETASRLGFAVEIVPATKRDILSALGPDANGLLISQESLPDLFALTASRIEENPKQFIVVQPYGDGRWKGGKAVIEYARDLSYTLVSIYDKQGHRQRIYSVRTNFTEHVARQQARSQTQAPPEMGTSPVVPEAAPRAPPPALPPAAVARVEPKSAPSSEPSMSGGSDGGYEWDEAKGTYVPVVASPALPVLEEPPAATASAKESPRESAPMSSPRERKRRRSGEEVTVATSRMSKNSPASSPDSDVWIPANSKKTEAALKVRVDNTTWVERRPKSRSKRQEAQTSVTPPKPAPPAPVSKTPASTAARSEKQMNDEWVPQSIQETPVQKPRQESAKSRATETVPSTEELLTAPTPVRKRSRKTAAKLAPVPEPPPAPPPPVVPSHAPAASPPPAAPPVSEPVSAPAAAPQSVASQDAVPSTEDLIAAPESKGPDTTEGDTWVPKPVPQTAPPPEAAPPPPTQVAMIPKSAPVDNSVENLLQMANQQKSEIPHDSDAWVPKKTSAPKPDVEINRALARLREQEKKQAAERKPVVKERRDVNNPEEGVLPVSTFEKLSGPMYGRHREYERRFFPGKKPKTAAPTHDFYVEEIDRKKEIHNVYFYQHQKGKAPKLVAVERHDRVSFMGNYDIDKEDKGKISTY